MELQGKVAVVTGAASGIGKALAERFAKEGAKLVLGDVNAAGVRAVSEAIGALAVPTDVSREDDIRALARAAIDAHGRIDLFCSNAGIAIEGGVELPDSEWRRIFDINFMAHLWAARAVLPAMLERGDGHFLATASAAGLLSQIGSAPYAVTKHAAVAFAEWMAITYGERGIKVSCLCPQGVSTPMLDGSGGLAFLRAGAIEPEAVAESVVAGLRAEQFLILPHPEVAEYVRRKASDPDRWIAGMQRLQARIAGAFGSSSGRED